MGTTDNFDSPTSTSIIAAGDLVPIIRSATGRAARPRSVLRCFSSGILPAHIPPSPAVIGWATCRTPLLTRCEPSLRRPMFTSTPARWRVLLPPILLTDSRQPSVNDHLQEA